MCWGSPAAENPWGLRGVMSRWSSQSGALARTHSRLMTVVWRGWSWPTRRKLDAWILEVRVLSLAQRYTPPVGASMVKGCRSGGVTLRWWTREMMTRHEGLKARLEKNSSSDSNLGRMKKWRLHRSRYRERQAGYSDSRMVREVRYSGARSS